MSERLDALTVREYTDRNGDKKSSWTKIGAAFPTRDGGYSITLDALPLPVMGERGLETRILLMVPKARDEAPRRGNGRQQQRRDMDRDYEGEMYGRGEDDGEVPW